MLTVVAADPDALVTVDTTDGVPVVELACVRAGCTFQLSMIAFAPIDSSADVTVMATALAAQHRTAAHPELVR